MAVVIASVAVAGCATAAGAFVGMACTQNKMAESRLAEARMMMEAKMMMQAQVAAAVPPPPQPVEQRKPAQVMAPMDEEAALAMGFSMEEARKLADAGQEASVKQSPEQVLASLQRGNARFWMGHATRPERSAFERRALICKQFPSTAILGCSDSRVPVEIVFDQGLGDMFVVRCAGNCLEMGTTASLQYAVHHLKVKVLVVMGHEACGAVKAAALPDDVLKNEAPALCKCLTQIKAGLDFERLNKIQDPRSQDREAVITNVKRQVEALARDEKIMQQVKAGELVIIGAFYEISSGIVDFNEVKK